MNPKNIFLYVSISIVLLISYNKWTSRPITHEPGIIAPQSPIQQKIINVDPFNYKKFKINPLTKFSAEARVLSRKRYYLGRAAKLVPVDLALGWGPMSDETILKSIKITQSNRFYFWFVKRYPIPKQEIISHSANMHLIPANSDVRHKIKKVRKGALVKFSGYLVKVECDDGWQWNSSLKRDDSGNGACELVWVEEFDLR
ncbi:MAG: hypothetical protein JSW07_05390 [bacterium]|nr:MAG: hypothetical protein JSW07_05390 [bacterium]